MTKIQFIHHLNQALNDAVNQGALVNKTVVLAQAALESNWGNSDLAMKANNLFAIKAGSYWPGETVWLPGADWNARNGWSNSLIEWRKYSDWTECIMDYAQIISEFSWYHDALPFLNDPDRFLKGILPNGTEPGWATDPGYYAKILHIASEIEAFGGPKWNDMKQP